MPDERLFSLASEGKLRKDDVLAAEVTRMIADPRCDRFVQHFSDQWFDLPAIDRVAVNPEFYPDFDDRLKADMRKESQLLLEAILIDNLSCLKLLDADFTFVNHRLANHYGLAGPRGGRFARVALTPDDRRGGLLSQGSFLLANSNGEDSHPIKRGVWLLDRLLDSPPPPPPPDVPELDPQQADLAGLSLKEQLEVHREKQACNSCHLGIDPWGIEFSQWEEAIQGAGRFGSATTRWHRDRGRRWFEGVLAWQAARPVCRSNRTAIVNLCTRANARHQRPGDH